MSQKKLMIGLPIALLLGGSAIAIGIVPGVRDWIDQTVPWLGINGPKVTEIASKPIELQSNGVGGLAAPEPFPSMENANAQFDVQLAQATLPVTPRNTVQASPGQASPGQGFGSRDDSEFSKIKLAQAQALTTVPSSGLNVPSSGSGTLVIQGASVIFPEDIPVSAQAEGIIMNLMVDDGSMIKAGNVMIEIDPRLAEAEVAVAEKELSAAELKANDDSNLKFSRKAKEVAEADVEISNDLLNRGAESYMDNRKKKLELEKAGFQVSVSEIEKKRDAADVGVKTAKLGAAKVQLELRKISAQRTGMVNDVLKRQFEWVRAGEPILKLTPMDKIRIKGVTPVVNDSPHLLLNAQARVTIFYADGKGETIDGSVAYVAPHTSGINQYEITIDLPNRLTPDGQYLFRQGMQATVEVTPRSR